MRMMSMLWLVSVLIPFCLASSALAQGELPPDDAYVVPRDGHLYQGDKRVRFWGAIGGFPGGNVANAEAVIQRLEDMGFNMVRYWRRFNPAAPYVKGDGSGGDVYDYFIWRMGQKGMRIWMPAIASGKANASDVDIIDDPATAEAWQKAVGQGGYDLHGPASIWDPRLKALGKRQIRIIADHVNQYNGLRWADDPTIAIWELTNEQWWFGRMISGQWLKLDPFFQRELLNQWNQWLKAKYADDAALIKAWGFVLPGESLANGTVLLTPMRSDTAVGSMREALGVREQEGVATPYGRDDFTAQRARDVIDFMLSIWVEHKTDQYNLVKSLGKSMKLSPLVMDTGIGYEIQAQYMQQFGDATCHDTYVTAFHHDPASKRFPWYSGLEELPRMDWEVKTPWVEQNKMPGKPYLIYETQIEQPGKYRAEFPLRWAVLAAIQEVDAICWHYFGGIPDAKSERPYDQKLDNSTGGHAQGLHYQYDEVQMSAMKAAAEIFKNSHLKSVEEPTLFTFGRDALLDPAAMDYGGSYGELGHRFIPTTYRYGMRLLIDPSKDGTTVQGPAPKLRQYEYSPLRPTPEIEYDWHRGHLKLDAPGAVSYVGFLAQYGQDHVTFGNGIVLRDVTIINDQNMPYPVTDDEKYVAFTLSSADGKPLGETSKAVLSLVSTSFNDGFKINHDKLRVEFRWPANKEAVVSVGSMPVRVARVGGTVEAPQLNGMTYIFRDWHMKEIARGVVENGRLTIPADKPVFCVDLFR